MKHYLITVLFTCMALPCVAKQPEPMPIFINFAGDDAVGKQFVYDFKDQLAHSALYRLDSSDQTMVQLQIISVTADGDGNIANNQSTALSVALIVKIDGALFLMDQWVLACGSRHTESMAKKLLGQVDSDIDTIRKMAAQKTANPGYSQN